jgi:hypothetical protein
LAAILIIEIVKQKNKKQKTKNRRFSGINGKFSEGRVILTVIANLKIKFT